MPKGLRFVVVVLASTLLGAAGGWFSSVTGLLVDAMVRNPVADWHFAVWMTWQFGAPAGALYGTLGFYQWLAPLAAFPNQRAIVAIVVVTLVTASISGALLGALNAPVELVPTAIGYFLACRSVNRRLRAHRRALSNEKL